MGRGREILNAQTTQVCSSGSDSDRGICLLEVCGKTQFDVFEFRVGTDDLELGVSLGSALVQNSKSFLGLRSRESRDVRLEDTGLVPGDFIDCVAQHGNMVDSQARNSSDAGLDEYVCTVELASNTALDDSSIDTLADIRMQCHQGQEAEVDRLGVLACGIGMASSFCGSFESVPRLEEVFGKLLFSQGLVVDLDTLAHESQVG